MLFIPGFKLPERDHWPKQPDEQCIENT